MKLYEIQLDARRGVGPSSHGEVRKSIIGQIAQTSTDEQMKDPAYLQSTIESLLSQSSYAHVPNFIKKRVKADVMDAFGITPDESNVSSFKRY